MTWQTMASAPRDGRTIKVKLINRHVSDMPDEIEVCYDQTTYTNGSGKKSKYEGWKYVDESKYREFWYQDYSFKGWRNVFHKTPSVNLNYC